MSRSETLPNSKLLCAIMGLMFFTGVLIGFVWADENKEDDDD